MSSATEIGFYHLTRTPIERALPRLLEKVLEAGKRAVVRVGSEERVSFLNAALWTYDNASFLPHGSAREGDPDAHPIWLTAGDDNANGAAVLILTDGVEAADITAFERCLELFDGKDETAVQNARSHWKAYQESGCTLTYWQQTERGGWEKKAEA
jgi:DNA polymerase-3 subunit chi